MKDDLFSKIDGGQKFEFNKDVALVFDDMLERSIPFYKDCQEMILKLCAQFAREGAFIYDLGCSTGTLLDKLAHSLSSGVRFVGLDNSAPMIEKASQRLKESGALKRCQLVESSLESDFSLENASMVIMNYTLQFVAPARRVDLVQKIFSALNPGGCFIMVEKLKGEGDCLDQTFIGHHHQFKKEKGYSQIEISRKKEALENILIPLTQTENLNLLKRAGFKEVDTFFRWFNFAGFLAIKND